jgi:hypothetical protein
VLASTALRSAFFLWFKYCLKLHYDVIGGSPLRGGAVTIMLTKRVKDFLGIGRAVITKDGALGDDREVTHSTQTFVLTVTNSVVTDWTIYGRISH